MRTVAELGRQLAFLQRFFRVDAGTPAESDKKAARAQVDEFGREFAQARIAKSGRLDFGKLDPGSPSPPFTDDRFKSDLVPDPKHDHVCRKFAADVARTPYLLEHQDGRCEWLLAPDRIGEDGCTQLAASRLLRFCKGSPDACLAVSRAANQAALEDADIESIMPAAAGKVRRRSTSGTTRCSDS